MAACSPMSEVTPPTLFQEDDVLDWFFELQEEGGGARLIRSTLKEAAKVTDYLDRTDAGRVIATAEWIAALRGHTSPDAAPVVQDLLAAKKAKIPDDLIPLCLTQLQRIANASETRELWEE